MLKGNHNHKLIDRLKSRYFWDMDVSKMNDNSNKRLIIERVFTLGTLDEIKLVVDNYGKSETVRVVQQLKCLDKKTLNFASKLLGIPKKNFRCYTKPLMSPHWNS